MGVDQIEVAGPRQPRQRVARQRLEPLAVHRHEAAERYPLSRTQAELRLHRFQEIELDKPLTERARCFELCLIGLEKSENALQILRALAFGIEQPLAEALAIDAGK